MVTAYTGYLNSNASGTLATAGTLGTTVAGSSGTRQSLIDTSTGYGECYALSNASAWAAAGSIGAASGHGWLWDVTTLEGQQFIAGNWTPTIRLQLSTGTATADFYVRAHKRTTGGAYTQIGSFLFSAISLTTSLVAHTWTAQAGLLMSFPNAGDKLYVDMWANITVNGASAGAVLKYTVDTTAGDGSVNAQIVSPGYQTIPPVSGVTTFYMSRGLHVGRTQ